MAWFGNQSIENKNFTAWDGYVGASRYSLSEEGKVSSISIYLYAAVDSVRLAIYSDDAGAPDALKCQTTVEDAEVGWNTIDVVTQPTLEPGAYWLAWQVNNSATNVSALDGGASQHAYRSWAWGAFPNPFGSAIYDAYAYSIYATYAPPPEPEPWRRRRYNPSRVLMGVADILDCPYPGDAVFLSGAQLTLLRNLTQYLHRVSTFVSEYQQTSYLVPTGDEWDALEAIVADMERILMGNENTIWGYNDRWFENLGETVSSPGIWYKSSTAVPAGEIHVLEFCWLVNNTTAGGKVRFSTVVDSVENRFYYNQTVFQTVPDIYNGKVTLREGDVVRMAMMQVNIDDQIEACVWGYKMKVPE